MSEPNDFEFLKDLPDTEIPKFSADQMVECGACKRNNPPTRLKCLYCGKDLEISDKNANLIRTPIEKPEPWENGFNLIWSAENRKIEDFETRKTLSEIFGLEPSQLSKLIDLGLNIPIARLNSLNSAELVLRRLRDLNLEATIIPDADFELEKVSTRLRAIEFQDEELLFFHFNNDEISRLPLADVNLIVVGISIERKIELQEQRQKGKENKTLASAEMLNDEILIDIYGKDQPIAWRIVQRGFDFSCLGEDKSLLAKENMKMLVKVLSEKAKNAATDNSYTDLREALGAVWETEETTSSKGWQRKSFGGYQTENAVKINNLAQFTRYSRLLNKLSKR